MITNIKGNLLESEANVLVHCANCFCTMGAGIAAQIAKHYPEAVEADNKTKSGDKGKLGSFSVGFNKKEKKFIVNLYGQYSTGFGRQVDYEALYNGLYYLRKRMDAFAADKDKMKSFKMKKIVVGFPYAMASDLAGGDWSIVNAMIQSCFADALYDVLIVQLDK